MKLWQTRKKDRLIDNLRIATDKEKKLLPSAHQYGDSLSNSPKDKYCGLCGSPTRIYVVQDLYFNTKTGKRIEKLLAYCTNPTCINRKGYERGLSYF